jgi:CRISPR-associated protein Cmr4
MFEEKRILFLYVETPLHVGAGKGAGSVDLPIQRERTTGYPTVQSSGLKGCLRSTFRDVNGWKDDDMQLTALFGKAGGEGENYAGAIAPGDARLLLFPVRSLGGVFAWVTSAHALANFKRAAQLTGQNVGWEVPDPPAEAEALVGKASDLRAGTDVVLEEFSFTPKESADVDLIAKWIADNALPADYAYWAKAMPRRLCILSEDAFRDFCMHGTEIQTHVRLEPETKVVAQGALWTTESLPVDTLLYAPLMATGIRDGKDKRTAIDVLNEIASLNLTRLQLGGDETTGQGWVAATFFPEVKK